MCQFCDGARRDVERYRQKAAAANNRLAELEVEMRRLLADVQQMAHNAAMADTHAKRLENMLGQ